MTLFRNAVTCLVAATCLSIAPVRAQAPVTALLKDPAVMTAREFVRQNEARVIEEQVELTEIPAPGFKEAARGLAVKQKFEALGLKNVRVDRVGQRHRRAAGPRAPAEPRAGRAPRHRVSGGDRRHA